MGPLKRQHSRLTVMVDIMLPASQPVRRRSTRLSHIIMLHHQDPETKVEPVQRTYQGSWASNTFYTHPQWVECGMDFVMQMESCRWTLCLAKIQSQENIHSASLMEKKHQRTKGVLLLHDDASVYMAHIVQTAICDCSSDQLHQARIWTGPGGWILNIRSHLRGHH